MARESINLKTGFIIKKKEEAYLNDRFFWEIVKKIEANVFEANLNDPSAIEALNDLDRKLGNEIYCAYPVMIVQGSPLIGKPLFKEANGKFGFRN
jgi:hypothetical protein